MKLAGEPSHDSRPAPLHDLRVLEVAHVASAPFVGMLLGDLGADVVKIEPPGGDMMRGWPPLESGADGADYSHNFASLNRNKRSIMLNLKSDTDLEFMKELVAVSDVLVENFRPGALDRLGLGFDEVSAFDVRRDPPALGAHRQQVAREWLSHTS